MWFLQQQTTETPVRKHMKGRNFRKTSYRFVPSKSGHGPERNPCFWQPCAPSSPPVWGESKWKPKPQLYWGACRSRNGDCAVLLQQSKRLACFSLVYWRGCDARVQPLPTHSAVSCCVAFVGHLPQAEKLYWFHLTQHCKERLCVA